tara:strand:+ start:133 stop:1029 length:897 start_codon:yes stop_codon:yes gene_type:complete
MAFKRKGFSKHSTKSYLSKHKKGHITSQDIRSQTYLPEDDWEGTRFSDEEVLAGQGAGMDFFGTEGQGNKTKNVIKEGFVPGKTKWSGKTGDVVTSTPGHKTLYIDKETKFDKDGKAKKKKRKKKSKKNIFNDKMTMEIDSIDLQERRAKRDAQNDPNIEEGFGGTVDEGLDWTFEGDMTNINKDVSGRQRFAQLDPKTGDVVEKVERTGPIGWFGGKKKTGRQFQDQATKEAYELKQKELQWNKDNKKQLKLNEKLKDQQEKKNPTMIGKGGKWVRNPDYNPNWLEEQGFKDIQFEG